MLLGLGLCACLAKPNPLHGLANGDTTTAAGSTTVSSGPTTTAASAPTAPSTSTSSTGTTEADGSSSGDTTAGDSTALVDEGLLMRYFLDEGNTNETPPMVLDAVPPALNLPVDYGSEGVLAYDSLPTGRGLRWSVAGADGLPCIDAEGTKIFDVQGDLVVTLELVAQPDSTSPTHSRFFHLGPAETGGRLTLSSDVVGRVRFVLDNSNTIGADSVFPVDPGERAVWHMVYDSAQQEQFERIRFYVDGERRSATVYVPPQQNAALDLMTDANSFFCLGNRASGERSFQGGLYYAAVYAAALTDPQIQRNAALLKANDDPPQ